MLDVHQLNVFLAAAETLNFTQAAQRLHMTQPSVSQHIQGLERHFDMQFFLRNGRSLELTDAGLALLPLARDAVALSVRIDETMESLKGKVYGHLIVGCSTTPGKYILPQLLARFHRDYPAGARHLPGVPRRPRRCAGCCEGEAHFALFSMDQRHLRGYRSAALHLRPDRADRAAGSPLGAARRDRAARPAPGRFHHARAASGTFDAVREALAVHNISTGDLRIVITLGNAEAIALAVQEGIGVGFISKMVVDRLCAGHGGDRAGARGLDICREIYIGRNNRRPATRAQSAFWNFLDSLNSIICWSTGEA